MKKFFFYILFFIATSTVTHAQITKGMVLTGVNLSTSSSQSESSFYDPHEVSYFNAAPSVGFAIKDNKMIGFWLSYGHHKSETEQSERESDSYGAATFFRRYIPLGKRFFLYGQAVAAFNVLDSEEIHESRREIKRESEVSLSLAPGVAYTLTKRFQLEAGIGSLLALEYEWDKSRSVSSTWISESKGSGISFSANANPRSELYIGFRIALGK